MNHLGTHELQTAATPVAVKATQSALSTHAPRTPFLFAGPISSARRVIASALRAGTWIVAVAKECRATALRVIGEEIQVSISARRRGYVKGRRCNVCHEAVHDDHEPCPKLWAGSCAICGPVLLDYYGHGQDNDCDPRRGHTITRRHKATRSEWMRARFRVLKPTPINATKQSKERSDERTNPEGS